MRLIGMVHRAARRSASRALLFTLTAQLGYDILRQLGALRAAWCCWRSRIHQFVVYSLLGDARSAA